ncbi:MAG: aminotransferase class IV [Acidobacteria bacterium]|nr:aminotransferase class IV [Acidobacteriota bacterium]
MMEPLVYLNGQMLPASQATLSIYDFGIILGATVTDLIRTFRGVPYRMADHLDRFYRSSKYAGIQPPLASAELARVTNELVEHNMSLLPAGSDLAVVYFITPGRNLIYAGSAGAAAGLTPTFCVHSFPLPFALFGGFFTGGIRIVTPSTRHVPSQCVDAKIKHRSRMHWWLADRESHLVDPAAVSLLLDLDGNLTETGGANFLLVRDGVVCSPTPRNILCGISRKVIMELCGELGIPFEERDVQTYDAITADEAFLVTTPYCMAPVTSVNGIALTNGAPGGPVFERLLAAWNRVVGLDIRAQFLHPPA